MSSTPYFTSRQRTGFTYPAIHSSAAAHGNKSELRRALHTLDARVGQLEIRNGGATINLKTSSPIQTPPPQAEVAASASNGVFRLQITNPQFKAANKGNTPNTPIVHKVEFSSTADFSSPTQLPPTNQTYLEVSQFGSARKWVKVSSSFDGKNYNNPIITGPLKS